MVGAAVVELCEKGDTLILEETAKVFKKEKEMRKGSCWPQLHSLRWWSVLCVIVGIGGEGGGGEGGGGSIDY